MIQIGKVIYSLLSTDATIAGYVSTKIYPLIAPETTTLPFIIYERHGDGNITKDNMGLYNTIVEITVLTEEYTEGINIAQAVYDKLQSYTGTSNSINVIDVRLTDFSETLTENAFIQKLNFLFISRIV